MRRYDGQIRTLAELIRAFNDLRSTVLTRLTGLPRGIIGYATKTADQSGITTETDVTGLTLTWTALANRRYEISTQFVFQQVSAAGTMTAWITNAAGTHLARFQQWHPAAGDTSTCHIWTVATPAAGSVTYKVRATTTAGTLFVGAAGVGNQAQFLVEDIGPA